MNYAKCYSRSTLRSFIEGNVNEWQFATINEHLEKCSKCEQLADTVDREIQDEKRALTPDNYCQEFENVRGVVENLIRKNAKNRDGNNSVFGPYELQRRISGIASNGLYSAKTQVDGRKCLIQICEFESIENHVIENALDKFRDLSLPLKTLNCVDLGVAGNRVFFEYEHQRGISFRSILEKRRTIPFEVIIQICNSIFLKLDQSLGRSGYHGSLSPESIFITLEGSIELYDLELISFRRASGLTPGAGTQNDVEFAAPEKTVKQHHCDFRYSDLFSIGTLLFLSLTGESVWKASGKERKMDILGCHCQNHCCFKNALTEIEFPDIRTALEFLLDFEPAKRKRGREILQNCVSTGDGTEVIGKYLNWIKRD